MLINHNLSRYQNITKKLHKAWTALSKIQQKDITTDVYFPIPQGTDILTYINCFRPEIFNWGAAKFFKHAITDYLVKDNDFFLLDCHIKK